MESNLYTLLTLSVMALLPLIILPCLVFKLAEFGDTDR